MSGTLPSAHTTDRMSLEFFKFDSAWVTSGSRRYQHQNGRIAENDMAAIQNPAVAVLPLPAEGGNLRPVGGYNERKQKKNEKKRQRFVISSDPSFSIRIDGRLTGAHR